MINNNVYKLNEDDAGTYVEDAVANLDEIKLEQLEELKQLEAIKNGILEREMKRLEGITNNPRAIEMKARLEYNKSMLAGLDVYIKAAKAETTSTTPDDSGGTPPKDLSWQMSGTVLDANNKPLMPAVVVSLENTEHKIRFTGLTDTKGKYVVKLNEEQVKSVLNLPLLLKINNRAGVVIHQEQNLLVIKPGESIERDFVVKGQQ